MYKYINFCSGQTNHLHNQQHRQQQKQHQRSTTSVVGGCGSKYIYGTLRIEWDTGTNPLTNTSTGPITTNKTTFPKRSPCLCLLPLQRRRGRLLILF